MGFASCSTYLLVHFKPPLSLLPLSLTEGARAQGQSCESGVPLRQWQSLVGQAAGPLSPVGRLALIITVLRTNYHMKKQDCGGSKERIAVIPPGEAAGEEVRPVMACVAGSCPCVYRLVPPNWTHLQYACSMREC